MSHKHKLLYVDDEPINLQLFQINFQKKFNVLTADSAIEGLEVLNNNTDISIVISDMKMPLMNGLEFIKLAKERFPEILYFILTGYGLTNEMSEAISSGMIIKYFSKPFNLNEIETTIEIALQKNMFG